MGLRSSPWNYLFADRLPASEEVLPQESSGLFVNPEAYAYKDRSQQIEDQKKKMTGETKEEKLLRLKRELTAPILSGEDLLHAQRAIEDLPIFQAQQKGVEQLESLYSKAADAPLKTNLMPILGLLGETSGTDYTKYYKPPETPEERRQLILGLANKLQSERGNLAESYKSLLSGLKVPRQETARTQNIDELLRQISETQGQTTKQEAGSTNVAPRAAGKGAGGVDNKRISKFTDELQKARIPDLVSSLDSLMKGEPSLLDPNSTKKISGFENVISLSNMAADKSQTGIMGLIGGAFGGDDPVKIQKNRQKILPLIDAVRKALYGSQLTEGEADKFAARIGDALNQDTDSVRKALIDIQKYVRAQIQNFEAGYRDIVPAYESRYSKDRSLIPTSSNLALYAPKTEKSGGGNSPELQKARDEEAALEAELKALKGE